MATVQDTVRRSLLAYPTLHETGGDVLAFLLCVIGNGYRWVDGELVQGDDDPYTPWTKEAYLEQAVEPTREHLPEDMQVWLQETLDEKNQAVISAAEQVVAEVDERAADWRITRHDYLLHGTRPSSNLWTAPADIKPDWAEAVVWVKNYLADLDREPVPYEEA